MIFHKNPNQPSGFSIVEMVIVFALSVVSIAVVVGVFRSRAEFAQSDAVNQVVTSINTVKNEATQGLGPADITDSADFLPNETIFGQAIVFKNDCNTKPCMQVLKLKLNANQSEIVTYETYEIISPQELAYSLLNESVCSEIISCHTPPDAVSASSVFANPINASPGEPIIVVIKNGSTQMYAFSGNDYREPANYVPARQGLLTIPTAQLQASPTESASWQAAKHLWQLKFDLSTGNVSSEITR